VKIARPVIGFFASLVLLSGVLSADTARKAITATLIEVGTWPLCHGPDCPPWPVPDEVRFCFQSGNNFYTGVYSPRPVPWANAEKKLMAWEGKPVEIIVRDRRIEVLVPGINVRLARVHKEMRFTCGSCAEC
jgi:hypothetical protein